MPQRTHQFDEELILSGRHHERQVRHGVYDTGAVGGGMVRPGWRRRIHSAPKDFGYLMCMAGSKSRRRHDFPAEAEAMAMPSDLDARLVEAARMGRYLWAAPLCSGKRVLDAGCGLAQGSPLLIRSGALEVVGVDSAEAIVEAARAQAPSGVRIERADILNLPFGRQAFDVVVCFDVIEHTEEPLEVLAALIKVLRDEGVLLLSWSSGAGLVAGTGPIPSEALVAD